MKIAFFDSGIGGLTVFKEALRLFPNHDYIYFADSDNAPYGARPQNEVEQLIFDMVDFLAEKNIDILVLACHTASRLVLEKLRNRYDFPIIGMHSGIDYSEPLNTVKKVLICGTDLSIIAWGKHLQDQPINAEYLSLQKLIVFAENGEFNVHKVFDYLYEKLAHFDWYNYHSVVLGCTHFPFFKNKIRALLPERIQILDGSLATVQNFEDFVPELYSQTDNSFEYYISKKPTEASFFSKYLKVLASADPAYKLA